MPRQRASHRKNWPRGMYTCNRGFKWRHPFTKRDQWLGSDLLRAAKLSRVLNAYAVTEARELMDEDKRRASRRGARSARRSARVAWAINSEIRAFYKMARELSERTSTEHQVDHIIPLLHPLVCGLHVETNLRVVVAVENQVKSNDWRPILEIS